MQAIKFKKVDKKHYVNETDEEIVMLVREGDMYALEYIMDKYKDFVRSKARTYFLIGADRDDIIQEGMIGLYKAIRDYNPEKTSAFKTFADLCVTRQIITAVKAATRQKHVPLNSYVSLNKPVFDDETEKGTLLDLMATTKIVNPEDILIGQENLHLIEEHISKKLSSFELKVLTLYLEGKNYTDIAEFLDKPLKSIDNALQRIKHKIEEILENKNVLT